MRFDASRIVGIAVAGAMVLVLAKAALAGEVADKAAQAETLLAEGKIAAAISALDASADAFWTAAPLSFRKVLFVDSVAGFGEYSPRAQAVFAPNSALRIYAEPVGYGWTTVADGERIGFTTRVEIRDAKGVIFAKSAEPAILEKVSKSRSHDFHITVTFDIPALKAGDYTLVLTVADEATGKSAPVELPLTIS